MNQAALGYNPSAPMAPTELLQVTVPQGAYPGMTLQVVDPRTNVPVQVVIPQGVSPGQTIQVQVQQQMAPPPQQMIYQQSPQQQQYVQSPQQYGYPQQPQVVYQQQPQYHHQQQQKQKGGDASTGILACLAGACICCTLCELFGR